MAETKKVTQPYFIQEMNNDYVAGISHMFILHGNIYDNIDNNGIDMPLNTILSAFYDDNVNGSNKQELNINKRIVIFYNIAQGMHFPSKQSEDLWIAAHTAILGQKIIEEMGPNWTRPKNPDAFIKAIYLWDRVSRELSEKNQMAKADKGKYLSPELRPMFIVTDADAFAPRGSMDQLGSDRSAIVALRNLAKDSKFGVRNRMILITRQLSNINESIRSEISTSYSLRKPSFEDRIDWLQRFRQRFKDQTKTVPKKTVTGQEVTDIVYANDFSEHQFAVQAAGMNIQQMKDVIMQSWIHKGNPIDYTAVMIRKQRALMDEYEGMLDFTEPEFGFEMIGGHDHFKLYCKRKIITPLKKGDKKLCSRGVLLTGPPGTGKTMLATALAKEAQMNFLKVDLGKCFGSLVGQSEANMRKLIDGIESAAPCIVFIDEIDSILSSGRTSQGDSGTSGRMFNSFMDWMSNPSRAGRIVVVAASNRPDLLDGALIRAGRFDAKLPILPPTREDSNGRKEILKGLTRKLQVKFHKESLGGTEDVKNSGLGKLLKDTERIWTGAEIEVVIKEALDNAVFAERKKKDGTDDYTIMLDDWNTAMDSILPNTHEVESMCKLALYYTDNVGTYCPPEWRAIARNKDALRLELGLE